MENKTFKVGEVVANITEEELKALRSSDEEQIALRAMIKVFIETATKKEKEYQTEIAEWWGRIRLKYKLPNRRELDRNYFGEELTFKISYETREIFVGVQK